MSKEVAAYAAGMFDGEGSGGVYITHTNSGELRCDVKISVVNTNINVLLWFKEHFGGGISEKSKGKANWKPSWKWESNGTKAIKFLKMIKPYTQVKSEIIEVCLQFPFVGSGYHRTPIILVKIQELYRKTKELNKRGIEGVVCDVRQS